MPHVLHWFRRDFRVHDNTALLAAAHEAGPHGSVTGVFVIDERWWPADAGKLGPFQAKFWLDSLAELRASLEPFHIPLLFRTSRDPVEALLALARDLPADAITFNKEYEPDQIAMDSRLEHAAQGVRIRAFKDAACFEEEEILTGAGKPYTVFTPYKNAYLKKLTPPVPAGPPPALSAARRPPRIPMGQLPTAADLRFPSVALDLLPGETAARAQLKAFCDRALHTYADTRDLPALSLPANRVPGTSRLSAHLNAGTLSIRQAFAAASPPAGRRLNGNKQASLDTFRTELVWRDFYRMILFHHPHTVSHAFNAKYAGLPWSNDPALLAAWCEARTGYPLIDAAMRQLLATGFMHNRLRMIAAMFLTKDLDCHWTLGERFFRRTLIDYDQASNVGGWQWSASTGTDAAPYFRVMNPALQSRRWDPDGAFIRHYLPELRLVPSEFIHTPHDMPPIIQRQSRCIIGRDYPAPIIDHAAAKKRAIEKFRRSS